MGLFSDCHRTMYIMHLILEHIDSLDIFKWIEDYGSIMNDKQFSLAIKGLRIRAKSKDVAYRILVKGQSRQEVIVDTGMQKAAVSQLINNILKNLDEQLKKNGLIYQQYVLPENLKPIIDALEEEHLNYYVNDPKKKK
jgi:TrfB transcriptional repressor